MKASELIGLLIVKIQEHGDFYVCVNDSFAEKEVKLISAEFAIFEGYEVETNMNGKPVREDADVCMVMF